MLWSEALDYLHDRNKELADAIRQVELIGEIPVDETEVAKLAEALGMSSQYLRLYPHAFAVMLVSVARYDYDSEFWPHVSKKVGRVLKPSDQREFGEQFEGYLEREKLATFRHLIRDEGALRFLAPILAHAIVPRALVPQFMEKAIWPAIQRGDYSAEAIQQRFTTQPPAFTARPVVRFILHGGSVARDVIERSISYAVAVTRGEDDQPDLPAWFCEAIRTWVVTRPLAGRQPRLSYGHRRLTPVLKYDSVYCRVTVELPYSDGDRGERWEVGMPGTGISYTLAAWDEAWRRTSHARVAELEHPFDTLQVTLRSGDDVLMERHYAGLRKQWPAMFFDARTGRFVPSAGTVTGTEWYLLRRTDSQLTASPPGTLRVLEELGAPLGSWDGYTVERVEAPGATKLTITLPTADATWWLEGAGLAELAGGRVAGDPHPARVRAAHGPDDLGHREALPGPVLAPVTEAVRPRRGWHRPAPAGSPRRPRPPARPPGSAPARLDRRC